MFTLWNRSTGVRIMKCLACGGESMVGGIIIDSNGGKPYFKQ